MKKYQNSLITQLLFISICSLSLTSLSFAGEDKGGEGHGGIDFLLPDGSYQPHELYLPTHSKALTSICEINDGLSNNIGIAWRKRLNLVVAALSAKLPAAGIQLREALQSTRFYVLTLDPKVKIIYTNDSGGFLQYSQTNGAIRIRDKVYIIDAVWSSYWKARKDDSDFDRMLVRTLHETLLKYYLKPLKNDLGEIVLAILKLAGELKTVPFEDSLKAMTAEQVSEAFKAHGLVPDNKSGDVAKAIQAFFPPSLQRSVIPVQNSYALSVGLMGEKVDDAEWKSQTYASEHFKFMTKERDDTIKTWIEALSKTTSIHFNEDPYVTLQFYSSADIQTFKELLLKLPPFTYLTFQSTQWSTEFIYKFKINQQMLNGVEAALTQAPIVCELPPVNAGRP